MAAYLIANYTVTNPEAFEPYPRAAAPTILDHGGEFLVADLATEAVEGSPHRVTVVARFESKEAARAWYDSEEYQKVVHLRTDNSEGVVFFCDGTPTD